MRQLALAVCVWSQLLHCWHSAGLLSESDSDESTLEYSLRPSTTPLNKLEQDDFDFYD